MTDADRRQQILQGALKVFSTEGYHKASIKKIAKAAGIKSSALIYHYFEDKKALINALVTELSPLHEIPVLDPVLQEQLLDIPPEQLLQRLGASFLSLMDDANTRNMLRLFLSEAVRMPEVADSVAESQGKLLQFLIRYIRHQQEKGNFREQNPETAARAFVGMVIVYIMTQLVFVKMGQEDLSTGDYVREIVSIYLDGMRSSE